MKDVTSVFSAFETKNSRACLKCERKKWKMVNVSIGTANNPTNSIC